MTSNRKAELEAKGGLSGSGDRMKQDGGVFWTAAEEDEYMFWKEYDELLRREWMRRWPWFGLNRGAKGPVRKAAELEDQDEGRPARRRRKNSRVVLPDPAVRPKRRQKPKRGAGGHTTATFASQGESGPLNRLFKR
jgi:hypothetical protein